MKKLHIEFTIETLEDFHIGSGFSSIGLYDDGQVTDDKGYPTINPETLKGLLKESARDYRRMMHPEEQIEDELFRSIFGYQEMSSLDLDIQRINKYDKMTEEPFVLRAQTAIDRETRIAKNTSLRVYQFGKAGIEFEVKLDFVVGNACEKEKEIEELLKNAIRNLKAIGGMRRRGYGLVHCKDIQSSWLDDKSGSKALALSNETNIRIVIELKEDTTFSESAQTGNLMRTLDYIPGTTILGMLRAVLHRNGVEGKTFLDDGKCRVTPFYPLPDNYDKGGNFEMIPIPFSLRRRKSSDRFTGIDKNMSNIPPWALGFDSQTELQYISKGDTLVVAKQQNDVAPEQPQADQEMGSSKSFGSGYLYIENGEVNKARVVNPKKTAIMRNSISTETQTTEENALFVQEKLCKHTKFVGEIRFNDQNDADDFKKLYGPYLDGSVNLHAGRGSKPVRIEARLNDGKPKDTKSSLQGNSTFTLTFLSDAILFDNKLRPMETLGPKWIEDAAGITGGKLQQVNGCSKTAVIQSFSALSGIRRFMDKAIAKGSCFQFKLENATEKEKESLIAWLDDISENGIGYRRHEGFGLVAVNHAIHQNLIPANPEKSTPTIKPETPKYIEAIASKNAMDIAQKDKLVKKILDTGLNANKFMEFLSILAAGRSLNDLENLVDKYKENTTLKEEYGKFKEFLKGHTAEIERNDSNFRTRLQYALKTAAVKKKGGE